MGNWNIIFSNCVGMTILLYTTDIVVNFFREIQQSCKLIRLVISNTLIKHEYISSAKAKCSNLIILSRPKTITNNPTDSQLTMIILQTSTFCGYNWSFIIMWKLLSVSMSIFSKKKNCFKLSLNLPVKIKWLQILII